MTEQHYVWFDWAVKHMLRNKANFEILEGFISVMIGKKGLKILEILESEGNQESESSKYNRVDVKARTADHETIIVEVQVIREVDFLERVLFGVAKAVTEQLHIGEPYSKIKKVYSISVVYFDLGVGSDYIYRGQTTLRGIHTDDELQISTQERSAIESKPAAELFPEYYIVRVRKFNPEGVTPSELEQWMEYLKTGKIRSEYNAAGLEKARQTLIYDSMNDGEKKAYRDYLDFMRNQEYNLDTSHEEGRKMGLEEGRIVGREEGRIEGREEGRKVGREEGRIEGREEGRIEGREEGRIEGREEGRIEGREEGRIEGREEGRIEGREEGRIEGREEGRTEATTTIARNLIKLGLSDAEISATTGLAIQEIADLRKSSTLNP